MKKESRCVSVTFPQELHEELKTLASMTYRTVPGYVRQIVRRYLENRGDCVEPRDFFLPAGERELIPPTAQDHTSSPEHP